MFLGTFSSRNYLAKRNPWNLGGSGKIDSNNFLNFTLISVVLCHHVLWDSKNSERTLDFFHGEHAPKRRGFIVAHFHAFHADERKG